MNLKNLLSLQLSSNAGVGKKERVESNPHSKIEPIMSGH
jgi:hypothetical protein